MPMLMIKCPSTGKHVPTGNFMDAAAFQDPTNVFFRDYVHCPHCGQTHIWDKADAWLFGDPEPK